MCALGMGTGLGRSGQVATGPRSPSPSAVDSLANLHSQRNAFLLLILILESVSPPCWVIMVSGDGISKFTLK